MLSCNSVHPIPSANVNRKIEQLQRHESKRNKKKLRHKIDIVREKMNAENMQTKVLLRKNLMNATQKLQANHELVKEQIVNEHNNKLKRITDSHNDQLKKMRKNNITKIKKRK